MKRMSLQITCKKATEYIILREEGKISIKNRLQLWLHFGICGLCKLFSQQSKFISKNAGHLHEHVEESLTEADKEKIIAGLQQ